MHYGIDLTQIIALQIDLLSLLSISYSGTLIGN